MDPIEAELTALGVELEPDTIGEGVTREEQLEMALARMIELYDTDLLIVNPTAEEDDQYETENEIQRIAAVAFAIETDDLQ